MYIYIMSIIIFHFLALFENTLNRRKNNPREEIHTIVSILHALIAQRAPKKDTMQLLFHLIRRCYGSNLALTNFGCPTKLYLQARSPIKCVVTYQAELKGTRSVYQYFSIHRPNQMGLLMITIFKCLGFISFKLERDVEENLKFIYIIEN